MGHFPQKVLLQLLIPLDITFVSKWKGVAFNSPCTQQFPFNAQLQHRRSVVRMRLLPHAPHVQNGRAIVSSIATYVIAVSRRSQDILCKSNFLSVRQAAQNKCQASAKGTASSLWSGDRNCQQSYGAVGGSLMSRKATVVEPCLSLRTVKSR